MASFSDASIRAIQPPTEGQKIYYDSDLAGFGLRVSAKGAKSFMLQVGTERRKITIGRYPTISLAQARAEAKRLLAEFTLGKVRPQSITYPAAVALFIEEKERTRRPSTAKSYKNKLGRLKFRSQLTDINHQEAARALDRIKAPSERTHVLVAAKVFFTWAMKRRYLDQNPFYGLSKSKSTPRKRVLTDEELKAIWKPSGPFADYVKLLLLTAQRRGELRHATLNNNIFTIDGSISKNHRTHSFPATAWAQSLWQPFPNFDFGKAKHDFDKETGVTGYTLHDLRRTVRTRLSALKVPPHICERILNHITYQGPMAEIYDQYSFMDEMTEAFHKLETSYKALGLT